MKPHTTPRMKPDATLRLAAARLLVHPDEHTYQQLPLIREVSGTLGGGPDGHLAAFLAHVDEVRPLDLAAHHAAVFDTRNRRCPYLTWWTDGDTRNRGLSLVRVKGVYREHGLEFGGEELPDYLPVMLEFAALEPVAGTELLQEHRAGLELLRLALTEHGTPYAHLLEAVCATLPGPSPATREEAKALARQGPPRERVGLEPLGPGIELPWPILPERTPA